MQIENSFDVPAPVEVVWDYMLDVERVVPCMPGAQLTETIDDSNWKGKVTIKLGPVGLNFAGKVSVVERDEDAHKVVLKGSGMEQRGKGAASATVTSTLVATPEGTRVDVVQDVKIQGQAAQFSRGMMQDVTAKLTKQFADCLARNITAQQAGPEAAPEAASEAGDATPAAPPAATAAPIGGLRLALGALGAALVRFLRRLFGRASR